MLMTKNSRSAVKPKLVFKFELAFKMFYDYFVFSYNEFLMINAISTL